MFEIAGGIILAVLFFWLLPLIIAGGVVLIGVGVLAIVGVLLYTHFRETCIFLSYAVLVIVSFGVPWASLQLALTRYPKFKLIVDGAEPFNKLKYLPLRVVVTGGSVIASFVAGFASIAYFASMLETYWAN